MKKGQVQKQRKREALRRARDEAQQLQEREQEQKRRRMRHEHVDFLNSEFPACSACRNTWECPGFVADVFRPTACVSCGHERDQHTVLRDYSDPVGFAGRLAGCMPCPVAVVPRCPLLLQSCAYRRAHRHHPRPVDVRPESPLPQRQELTDGMLRDFQSAIMRIIEANAE
jgi:hypothetical protein